MSGLEKKEERNYLSILGSDGTFRQQVEEGTPDSVKREYETSDKETGVKYELKFGKFTGLITKVEIYEGGKFGANILVHLKDDDANEYILSLKADSPFGEQFMMKLPNINLEEEVKLVPYSFADKKNAERRIRGLTIEQDGEKVSEYFTEYTEGKGYKNLHGMPEGPKPKNGKAPSSEKWKIYFAERREWLKEYLLENDLASETEAASDEAEEAEEEDDGEEEVEETKVAKKKGKGKDDF